MKHTASKEELIESGFKYSYSMPGYEVWEFGKNRVKWNSETEEVIEFYEFDYDGGEK